MKWCCLKMPCIRCMARRPSGDGRRVMLKSRWCRPHAARASLFKARSIWKPVTRSWWKRSASMPAVSSGCRSPFRRSTRASGSSTCFRTMLPTTTPGWCKPGWRSQAAGSSCTSSPLIARIERLWGLMHRHTTHNKCHKTFNDFASAVMTFLRRDATEKWHKFCDQVTDNLRVIDPTDFRVIA